MALCEVEVLLMAPLTTIYVATFPTESMQ